MLVLCHTKTSNLLLTNLGSNDIIHSVDYNIIVVTIKYAGMAELADALDSGSSDFTVIQVRPLLPAP